MELQVYFLKWIVDWKTMNDYKFLKKYFDDSIDAIVNIDIDNYTKALNSIKTAIDDNRKIFVIGNGGSALNASHLALEIKKEMYEVSKVIFHNVMCLTENIGTFSAYANDCSYDNVFSEPILRYGKKEDILIAFISSGKSVNILKAIEVANKRDMRIILFCGSNNPLKSNNNNICINIHSKNISIIESLHNLILHSIKQFMKKE